MSGPAGTPSPPLRFPLCHGVPIVYTLRSSGPERNWKSLTKMWQRRGSEGWPRVMVVVEMAWYKTGQLRSPDLPFLFLQCCVFSLFISLFLVQGPFLHLLFQLTFVFSKIRWLGLRRDSRIRDGFARRIRRQVRLNYRNPGAIYHPGTFWLSRGLRLISDINRGQIFCSFYLPGG